jgi:Flp pilus assembly protein TadG
MMTAFSLRTRVLLSKFGRSNSGNIAIMFGILIVPVLSFVGASIDYTRANAARTSMQAALDSTALMLSKDLSDGTITASQINTKAQAYFTALFNNPDAKSATVTATYTASTSQGSTIVMNGTGYILTDFMKVAGFPNLNFNTSSTAAWGNVRMRVAMVLDNTGSMADDGKMPAMQNAAKSLVDQLSALSKTDGDMYISVTSRSFRSRATSTSAPATTISPGSTGVFGTPTATPIPLGPAASRVLRPEAPARTVRTRAPGRRTVPSGPAA